MGPYHWVLGSLMDEGDDFCQRLRKSVIAVMFFPGSFIAFYTFVLFVFFSDFTTWTQYAGFFAICCTLLLWWGGYLLLRKWRHVSGLQAGVAVWGTTVLLQYSLWLSANVNRKPLSITLMLIAVLLQIPKIYVYLTLGAILTLFSDWNAAYIYEPDKLLLFPGATTSEPVNVLIFGIQVSLLLAVVIHNFIRQVEESERRGAALKAANEMTLAILGRQRKYETGAITDILEECKVAGVVEAELIAIYEVMNENLMRYRPFLPNYLFLDNTDNEEAEEGEGESESEAPNKTASLASGHASGSEQVSRRPSSTAGSNSRGKRHSSVAMNSFNKRGALFSGRITFALVDINTDRLTIKNAGDSQHSTASTLKAVAHAVYALAKETKASVHSMLGDTVQLTWNATSSVALCETKGAVFLARLAKALTKSHGLASNPSPKGPGLESAPSSWRVSGAVCSGNATVHNVTTDSQQTLIIEAAWLPSLEGCFDLAKQVGAASNSTGCLLMDGRTMKGSNLEIQSCPVEQVSYTENGKPSFLGIYGGSGGSDEGGLSTANFPNIPADTASPKVDNHDDGHYPTNLPDNYVAPKVTITALVHQLLGEHIREDDEWMYQLQDGIDETNATGDQRLVVKCRETLKLAVAHISEGSFKEGATKLEEVADLGVIANAQILRALGARCAKHNNHM